MTVGHQAVVHLDQPLKEVRIKEDPMDQVRIKEDLMDQVRVKEDPMDRVRVDTVRTGTTSLPLHLVDTLLGSRVVLLNSMDHNQAMVTKDHDPMEDREGRVSLGLRDMDLMGDRMDRDLMIRNKLSQYKVCLIHLEVT